MLICWFGILIIIFGLINLYTVYKTDEDNLGFSYKELDDYLLEGVVGPHKDIIEYKHKVNLHKLKPMPSYRKEN